MLDTNLESGVTGGNEGVNEGQININGKFAGKLQLIASGAHARPVQSRVSTIACLQHA